MHVHIDSEQQCYHIKDVALPLPSLEKNILIISGLYMYTYGGSCWYMSNSTIGLNLHHNLLTY